MSLAHAIFMGLIQGLTEFLPVSSSGHLALFKILFHVNTDNGILFDVFLHIATLIAVVIVYYKDVFKLIKEFVLMIRDLIHNIMVMAGKRSHPDRKPRKIITTAYRKFVAMIVVSTIPTGIIGFAIKDFVERSETSLLVPGICLIITAAVLFLSDLAPDGRKGPKTASYPNAVIIGIVQGLATLPGISRSGSTIATSVFLGFDRRFAVKYSFILSIPAILGALVLQLKDLGEYTVTGSDGVSYVVGMIVAAVVGYIAIKWMLKIVRNKKFKYFSIYCLIIGVISLIGYAVM